MSEIINNAIVHYRDDLDLQNLIDFGQKKVWVSQWSGGLWVKVNVIPRDASPSVPVELFITCQVMASGKGFGKKPYVAECFKCTFKDTEQYIL